MVHIVAMEVCCLQVKQVENQLWCKRTVVVQLQEQVQVFQLLKCRAITL